MRPGPEVVRLLRCWISAAGVGNPVPFVRKGLPLNRFVMVDFPNKFLYMSIARGLFELAHAERQPLVVPRISAMKLTSLTIRPEQSIVATGFFYALFAYSLSNCPMQDLSNHLTKVHVFVCENVELSLLQRPPLIGRSVNVE